MRLRLVALGIVLAISVGWAADVRRPAKFGDVTLQGPVGDRLARMIRNHVTAKDAVYLTECFRSRSETEMWQSEFWGKYMHGACPLWELTKCPTLNAKIDASAANEWRPGNVCRTWLPVVRNPTAVLPKDERK